MPKVIIINGYPGSGKDTFVEYCAGFYPRVHNLHTSDRIQRFFRELGWNGAKTPRVRQLMADLLEYSYEIGTPFRDIAAKVWALRDQDIVFIHCREYEHVARLQETYNALTVFVSRKNCKPDITMSKSDFEAAKNKESYDVIIDNGGDLIDLHHTAFSFIHSIITGEANNYDFNL